MLGTDRESVGTRCEIAIVATSILGQTKIDRGQEILETRVLDGGYWVESESYLLPILSIPYSFSFFNRSDCLNAPMP